VVGFQDAVHRAFGADVLPFIEQAGVRLRRGKVDEAGLVQEISKTAVRSATGSVLGGLGRAARPAGFGLHRR
jgi:hypothetical protein